mgnify:FL=1|tara:strand:- start:2216 stop:2437 length:222 start_codon:yes stop_codon:yes gene_type:complete
MNMSEFPTQLKSEGMSATDVSMIIAGGAAALASIIYSLKHVKKSKCCGASCEQEVDEEPDVEHGSKYKNVTEL